MRIGFASVVESDGRVPPGPGVAARGSRRRGPAASLRFAPRPELRSRAALLLIAGAAAVGYAWGIRQASLHDYYGPAVKSMSISWRAWLYGGYDPSASITLDKLPGAFMIQALFVRVLGFHPWVVILPQVLAAVAAVLVLYRTVRRWLGTAQGLLAAALLATMPVLAALAHSQISDGLLVLFLVLAADAGQRALTTGRLRSLLLCGVWVGLAFQTKMVQAWGVVPAIGLAYLITAPGRTRARVARLSAAGAVAAAVSLWQVILFALTPAASRPYADGSTNNSLWSMIFEYNLSTRFGVSSPDSVGGPGGGPGGPGGPGGSGGTMDWGYLFSDQTAPQIGWAYPLALAGLVLGLIAWRSRRRGGTGRVDPVRGGYLMWGT